MITQFPPNSTYLDKYIDDGYKNKFSTFLFMKFDTLGKYVDDMNTKIETWRLPLGSIFTDYWWIVGGNSSLIEELDLSNDQVRLNHYRFNPKRLSYDLYGTVELWQGLLEINKVKSMTEFNFEKIRVFNKSKLYKTLETLLILTGRIKEDTY